MASRGVATRHPEPRALWPWQRPVLQDGQHSLMVFMLLTGGGLIVSMRHLHVPPVILQHVVLLEGPNSASKKTISHSFTEKNPWCVRAQPIVRTSSISLFPLVSVLQQALRFPGQGNAVGLGPLTPQDPAAMQMHNSAAAATVTTSNTQQAILD